MTTQSNHPHNGEPPNDDGKLAALLTKLDAAIGQLAEAPDFAKPGKLPQVLDTARRAMLQEGGCAAVESRAMEMEQAGLFQGSDWATPQFLLPSLTVQALQSPDPNTVVVEALSELRLLPVARGETRHALISAEQAHHYLTQVMALNLSLLFGAPTEAERATQGRLANLPRQLFQHLATRIGYEHIIDRLIEEIWRILNQRPIQVEPVKRMITQIAICQADPSIDLGASGQGADRLVSSLFGPTQACREDPGVDIYRERLASMDTTALQAEATGFARAMHDTGLVSPYHAVLLQHLTDHGDHLLAEALGLSATGRDCLLCYQELVRTLIRDAILPETAQAAYGLALMLERGILYQPPVAPAMWRQLGLPLSEWSRARLNLAYGEAVSPSARLLEGVLCMLGQPLGVGQGNNPTCQSARALSMWAYNDPDYLLQMVAWAARDDEIIMHFEGQPISSMASLSGVASELPMDLDPVSLIVVPHLDRIYAEMGRRCIGREGDPHRWVNPEFHGWWSGRGFRINVDVASGQLNELDTFLRHFYASYHPDYNGNQPLIHPQPAGIAVTDSAARFIGWHAITILRAGLDPEGTTRVYFYNPNNDSGQDWGDDVKVSTAGRGERFGEASLPFDQFASRLYIFHHDPLERGELAQVPQSELDRVIGYIERSWGADRLPPAGLQATEGNTPHS
ncbi:hypothetical protein [Halomonas elongata]|uniref:Uncharacterized protein n=1 Tax=Halomonas elongata (strain ATCC 33173 / DSM 2581 / NBRC 15536 / NCIMB 2198 / 1H9) TaxID=768066 RepID=E1VA88_HALED|nr:hypothetical protein [Halomonas elongata]MBW5798660.1 hypothetical protein [Halomonas elongata]RAW06759.1 hypothetical protein DKQ62_12375 [Halomonas elongata]WBF19178.1 hypothetical protein LM502_05680 [Halomonas elongata]WPU48038.1 hypothetical protein SR933_03905 [Halomonas elongata DSM 2581]WVI72679.1 hypothetical protein VO226_05375 [Halomonas elongata]